MLRRALLLGLASLPVAGCDRQTADKVAAGVDFATAMLDITKRHGGRIGVSAIDAGSGARLSVSAQDRFGMMSVFKWILAAAVLARVDKGELKLDQVVRYSAKDLIAYSPVTEKEVKDGRMAVGELCAATVSKSDNTAANLLLPLVGGPEGLTKWIRSLGDAVTRCDRKEPELNVVAEGDPRDTTTPEAMTQLLQIVFSGAALEADSIKQLRDWMEATSTGDKRIRAGVPSGWTVGNKTGTANGAVNDVAVIWPKSEKTEGPIFLSIFTTGGALEADAKEQVVADIARLVCEVFA
ncbi:class A beta-lactamase [Asticcacaulis biprosthecium]|uniref:class A beta-lactamase n=1 Tax=Asticcacaulis biprosthecium TaxID=76891 RepID=UPI0002DEA3EE|nr:class A beta-lactamase [Asticcacaulis biprosthecium]